MELAFITPTAYLEDFATQGDLYLALAHLVDDNGENDYARFHRREAEQGKRVILDNGLFEGAQVSTDELLRRAAAIKASCVCAPDVLYDSKGTIKAFKEFIRAKQEVGLVGEVMGIPQADNPSDWWDCFHFMQSNPNCDIIGLSILSVPKSFGKAAGAPDRITPARVHLLEQLSYYKMLSRADLKPCHLLGLGESYADIITAMQRLPKEVVSNDSSSAFVHGIQGIRYDRFGHIPGGKDRRKLDFDMGKNQTHPLINAEHIQHNIDTALAIRGWEWQ